MSDEVVIFGRPPVAGQTKTRLALSIGVDAAARVAAVLLDHTLEVATASRFTVRVALASSPELQWAASLGVPWDLQPPGDLGERMATCFESRFAAGARRVVLIGSDCPRLEPSLLSSAFEALDDAPVVLGPASDGGYWLVGQRQPARDMFTGIPFSASATLDATRQRLRELRTEWRELEPLDDLDTGADLARMLAAADDGDGLAHRIRAAIRGAEA